MKNSFIYALAVSLVISGIMVFGVLYRGIFGDLQLKMVISASAVALYSIYFICCSSALEKQYSIVGKSGLVVTFVGLFFALFTTWVTPDNLYLVLFAYVLSSIAFCFAHCSLMLLVKPYNLVISVMRWVAICSSIITSLLCIYAQITGLRIDNIAVGFCVGALIVLVIVSITTSLLSIAAKNTDS